MTVILEIIMKRKKIVHCLLSTIYCGWLGSVVVGLWTCDREVAGSTPGRCTVHCCVATPGKLFTHMCLCIASFL